jgi:hypothetical protein
MSAIAQPSRFTLNQEFGFDTSEPGAYEASVSEESLRRVTEESGLYQMIFAGPQP